MTSIFGGKDPHSIVESAVKIFNEIHAKLDEAEKLATEKIATNAKVIQEKTTENDSLEALLTKIGQQKQKISEFLGL